MLHSGLSLAVRAEVENLVGAFYSAPLRCEVKVAADIDVVAVAVAVAVAQQQQQQKQ